jgi:hypothetical protein
MKLVGMPAEQISGMQHAPIWPVFEALGPSLAHDHIGVMGETAAVASIAGFQTGHIRTGDEGWCKLPLYENNSHGA